MMMGIDGIAQNGFMIAAIDEQPPQCFGPSADALPTN
jgi:hypothetical protein